MPYFTVEITEKEQWNQVIHAAHTHDFYHTWYYHQLSAANSHPFIFVFEKEGHFIAVPLLKRNIEDTSYFDCTSVYGYAGPLSSHDFRDMSPLLLQQFSQAFLQFLKKKKIVSVFTRLHPLIHQHFQPGKTGGLYDNGKTVVIDLSLSVAERRQQYRKAFRSKINQLRDKGYKVRQGVDEEDIASFAAIYLQNMQRLGASANYHFDKNYFSRLLQATGFRSDILLASYEGRDTAGVFLTCCNNIMQLHLAATHEDFIHDSPMRLLVEEASIFGQSKGMRHLHLGGGVGGQQDSLFNFKAGFSDQHLDFKTWRLIADTATYKALTLKKAPTPVMTDLPFPVYRFL
ncbi:GNAT family N-acetyltransferase [Chitinophaga oryzae]|uniref:GNAT family N-acetyltransferase n=1 Tax=Chitinophaga oryzae TaxID=2725414 RepID=A0AAE6ZFY6_9BACT|nr:GNAT family N-acetyltransferase [Chitinophaga oryzae]QJB32258.1 GNAT family N-acetyltransferase [Chitinophaga oryzae]QJB38719.1 GNAT family N-acetyltransferase [Chitinophaga oryzae]